MIGILLACCLSGASFDEEFRLKLAEIESGDARRLLDLGKWCETRTRPDWAYRAYTLASKGEIGPAATEATVRLATIEIARKEYETAYRRLRKLVKDTGSAEASELLKQAETDATRRQRQHLARANEYFSDGAFGRAKKAYTEAYKLLPSAESPADFVPPHTILKSVARCVDKIDDQFFSRVAEPFKRSIRRCTACKKHGGFVKCAKCGGKGYRLVWVRVGRLRLQKKERCGYCNGLGWRLCDTCRCLCYATDFKLLTKLEWKAMDDVIDKYRNVHTLKLSIDRAMKEMETILLKIDRAAALSFLRAIKPTYARTEGLRQAIEAVPPPASAIPRAKELWRKHKSILDRADFLSAYAVEYAEYVKPFDCLRATKRKPNFRAPPVAAQPTAELTAPEVLSAFPEEGTSGWLFVKGVVEGYEEDETEPFKGILTIQGSIPHNIRFFTWLPAAQPHLDRLESGAWRSRMAGLSKAYPFNEVLRKLQEAPRGKLVVLAGRFLRDRLGFPRNWFEIWDVAIGLTPRQEELLAVLRQPVDLNYASLEMGNLVQILRFFGVEPSLAGITGTEKLRCVAEGCPLGILLERVGRHLDRSWFCQGDRVVLGTSGSADTQEDLKAALTFLRHNQREYRISVGTPGEEEEPEVVVRPEVPADVPALNDRRKAAIRAMDYLTATECYRALIDKAEDDKKAEKLKRQRAMVSLFHELTAGTPISRLSDADQVHAYKFQLSSGSERTIVVEVLSQTPAYLEIQTGYGGKVRLPLKLNRILKHRAFTKEQWRARKLKKLAEMARPLAGASPIQKVNTLFLLALFCKTNRFPEKGTSYLVDAIKEEQFPWLIETFFPRKRARLRELWYTATGRQPPVQKQDPPIADVVSTAGGDDPDADEGPPDDPDLTAPLPVGSQELRDFAFKLYRKGRASMRRSLPGNKKPGAWAKRALSQFKKSQDALRKVQSLDGSLDSDMASLATEVGVLMGHCLKNFGFFDK